MSAILIIIGVIATTLLGSSNPFGRSGIAGGSGTTGVIDNAKFACKPAIDTSRVIKVDVRNGLEPFYVNNPKSEFNKEDDEWVLVKTEAPIPGWKAYTNPKGSRAGEPYSEMEHIGAAIALGPSTNPDDGKEIFLGVGWCNPQTGSPIVDPNYTPSPDSCLDPLVQDIVYVVTRKGVASTDLSAYEKVDCDPLPDGTFQHKVWLHCFDWGGGTASQELYEKYPRNQENLEKYYWSFNVYYKASKLPANPTVDDLPCWIRKLADNCPNGGDILGQNRMDARNIPGCEATVLAATDPDRPRLVIDKSYITITTPPPSGISIADHYISLRKMDTPPTDPIIGTAYNNHFDVRIRVGDIAGIEADHILILDPRRIGHDGPYWIYVPLLDSSSPNDANTLQLGSFTPGIPSFFYEWWTPACKPAIYLYPEKEMQLSVKVKPEGYITQSIPEHGNGWNITAFPDGKIINNMTSAYTIFPYLYYEAALNHVQVPKDRGWIRVRKELPAFFAETLSQLGLNDQERKDFLEYWIPKLQEGEKWFITLIEREELDRVEPIEFSTKPDTFIRVRFYFEKITDKNMNTFSLTNNNGLLTTIRPGSGFTAVDWGGILANGSCGTGEVSK